MDSAEASARKALNRLKRALEKADRELETLSGALIHAEGEDFPAETYSEVASAIRRALDFADEEGARLQEKTLHAGGLEAGRVRRG